MESPSLLHLVHRCSSAQLHAGLLREVASSPFHPWLSPYRLLFPLLSNSTPLQHMKPELLGRCRRAPAWWQPRVDQPPMEIHGMEAPLAPKDPWTIPRCELAKSMEGLARSMVARRDWRQIWPLAPRFKVARGKLSYCSTAMPTFTDACSPLLSWCTLALLRFSLFHLHVYLHCYWDKARI